MQMHFNLLTGEFLVNGLPLARLPSDYENHETYRSLFGKSQLEVMPSDVPGMKFSSQKQYAAHTVHLGKNRIPDSDNFDVSVRATKEGQTWEFVPPRVLARSFPDAFIQKYAHWYSVKHGHSVDLFQFQLEA
ncbi:hypothetical protein PHISP_04064 [Aspergillus sp. HF37]|nr:hypothetical protein PHISP_04064 [Aspergillus sp. HF37]